MNSWGLEENKMKDETSSISGVIQPYSFTFQAIVKESNC